MTVPIAVSLIGLFVCGVITGIFIGVAKFGEQLPIGVLEIKYAETDEPPYIFLELWNADDISERKTANLIIAVTGPHAPK